jgi:hypothetical protein
VEEVAQRPEEAAEEAEVPLPAEVEEEVAQLPEEAEEVEVPLQAEVGAEVAQLPEEAGEVAEVQPPAEEAAEDLRQSW